MSSLAERLHRHFAGQAKFATTYSPLYAHLFATGARWLEQPEHPVTRWLLQVGQDRDPFDIPLLLAAAIHRDILADDPLAQALTAYYPTVGGRSPADDPALPSLWETLILARQVAYAPFIRTATVQTNETGRGLAWLWPLLCTGWTAVNLVDLGASAGLNLVAERRAYRLQDSTTGATLADVGMGAPVQFVTQVRQSHLLPALPRHEHPDYPQVLHRTGCDLAPFRLVNRERELTLMAYVWGDQPHRLERLREGIAALHEVSRHAAALVHLLPANLPDELPAFLRHVPHNPAPVLVYNTWMTQYLRDRGRDLRHHLSQWAKTQSRPVLWMQWEPLHDGPEPPIFGWCAWLADYWHAGQHQQWQLGWVHPHGTDWLITDEINAWTNFWLAVS